MKHLLFAALLAALSFVRVFAADAGVLKEIVDDVLAEEAPNLKNSRPDGKLTAQIARLSEFADELELEEPASADEALEQEELFRKTLIVMSALEERRVYRYLLWAENQLRICTKKNFPDCSQQELFSLYKTLSEINLNEVKEPILAREITSALAGIYDCLDSANKPEARIFSVRKNADFYSREKAKNENHFSPRKTPSDF